MSIERALPVARGGWREVQQRARIRGPARELVVGVIERDLVGFAATRTILDEDLSPAVYARRERHRSSVRRERGRFFKTDEIRQPLRPQDARRVWPGEESVNGYSKSHN